MKQLDIFSSSPPVPAAPAKVDRILRLHDHVLNYFKDHKYISFTPHQIWLAAGQQYPLSTFRDILEDLVADGHIVLTGDKRPGMYGGPNDCYTYSRSRKSKNELNRR